MPKKPETLLREKVMKWLATQPETYAIHAHGDPYSTAGIPDLLICCRGGFIAIELKVGAGKLTKLQGVTLEAIAGAGGVIAKCTSLEEVQTIVHDYEDRWIHYKRCATCDGDYQKLQACIAHDGRNCHECEVEIHG